jgi:hypothetical protein
MNPRIYTYKITFPHQGWWYWGWHKEKKFGEDYSGSPKTHRQKWEDFDWEIQILEFFECKIEAQKVEKRLIGPDLNNPMCLNESNGGEVSDRHGEFVRAGIKASETWVESARERARKQGRINVENGHLISIAAEGGRVCGKLHVESGHLQSISHLGGKASKPTPKAISNLRKVQNQMWECTETGVIMNAGNLAKYHKKMNIDKTKRRRVE